MTNHVIEQIGHEFPNRIGFNTEGLDKKVRRFDYITVGGMFTIVEVRNDIADCKDPGW